MYKIDRNNTNVSNVINEIIKQIKEDYKKDDTFWGNYLSQYQYICKNFVCRPENSIHSRGMLFMWDTGVGKTRGACSIILDSIHSGMNVVIICAKTLHNNIRSTLDKMNNDKIQFEKQKTGGKSKTTDVELIKLGKTKKEYERLKVSTIDNIKYVALDAFNSAKQLEEININKLENPTLIVVDEVHNLTSSIITSETSNARKIYNILMKCNNIKIILLSGTPIVKSPFEIVPLFNLLSGYELLPTSYNIFNDIYMKGKNKEKLQNRLMGLVSSVINLDDTKKAGDKGWYPVELPLIVDRVEMEPSHYRDYLFVRGLEDKEMQYFGSKPKSNRMVIESAKSGSYYVKSRTISTYYKDKKGKVYSPKLDKIKERILTLQGKHIVYSQFVDNSLINLGLMLEESGYENALTPDMYKKSKKLDIDIIEDSIIEGGYIEESDEEITDEEIYGGTELLDIEDDNKDDADSVEKYKSDIEINDDNLEENILIEDLIEEEDTTGNILPDITTLPIIEDFKLLNIKTKKLRYAIISGMISQDLRIEIIKIYNSKENINGELINVLLLSKIGTEGLDLKNTKYCHCIESYWNISRFRQFKARAIRISAMDDLPIKERKVQPFLYLTVANKEIFDKMDEKVREAETIDEKLYNKSLREDKINSEFVDILRSVSIDCTTNCYTCNPTNKILFTNDYSKDILTENNCKCSNEKEVEAELITLDGVEYYKNNNKVYTYDKKLGAYLELDDYDIIAKLNN